MSEQNFKNHSRYVPLFHFVAFPAAIFPLVSSVIHLFKTIGDGSGRLHAAAMVSLSVALVLALWFARAFALKAQDRAIRAEENFRYYIATGKTFDSRLRMGQIIALRFAGDNEFVALAKKAVDENLSAKQIKMAITNWKADNNRV
ncbi:DUF6526 family protein [Ferruginibacter sp. SUN106]|uniref:DUF6526 family protein n=1 Tax=Ferruginibacter sp. SUN106 TaxID=2978348 RepID=UPI003D36507B